jgi:hypothetical protein
METDNGHSLTGNTDVHERRLLHVTYCGWHWLHPVAGHNMEVYVY